MDIVESKKRSRTRSLETINLRDIPELIDSLSNSQPAASKKIKKKLTTCATTVNKEQVATINNTEDVCAYCAKVCDAKHHMVCDFCNEHFHPACCGFTDATRDELALELLVVFGYTCAQCKNELQRIIKLSCEKRSSDSSDKDTPPQEASSYSSVIRRPSGSGNTCPQITNTNADLMAVKEIVRTTLKDTEKRKKNIIITGLIETNPTDDVSSVLQLLQQELNLKPYLAHNSTRRLGAALPGKPRRLLVRLNSEVTASEILRMGRHLRKSCNDYVAKNVYINADMSKEDAKMAYEKRQEKRRERERLSTIEERGDMSERRVDGGSDESSHRADNVGRDGRVRGCERVSSGLVPDPGELTAVGGDTGANRTDVKQVKLARKSDPERVFVNRRENQIVSGASTKPINSRVNGKARMVESGWRDRIITNSNLNAQGHMERPVATLNCTSLTATDTFCQAPPTQLKPTASNFTPKQASVADLCSSSPLLYSTTNASYVLHTQPLLQHQNLQPIPESSFSAPHSYPSISPTGSMTQTNLLLTPSMSQALPIATPTERWCFPSTNQYLQQGQSKLQQPEVQHQQPLQHHKQQEQYVTLQQQKLSLKQQQLLQPSGLQKLMLTPQCQLLPLQSHQLQLPQQLQQLELPQQLQQPQLPPQVQQMQLSQQLQQLQLPHQLHQQQPPQQSQQLQLPQQLQQSHLPQQSQLQQALLLQQQQQLLPQQSQQLQLPEQSFSHQPEQAQASTLA